MKLKKILSNLFILLGLFGFILGVSSIDSWNTTVLLIIGLPIAFVLWAIYLWIELVYIPRKNYREMVEYAERDLLFTQSVFDQDDFDDAMPEGAKDLPSAIVDDK